MDTIIRNFQQYIQQYTSMKVFDVIISCPYWMNKLKSGSVIVRGFENGKGNADSIRSELTKRLLKEKIDPEELNQNFIQKFARRHRIGIDCSGFVFRCLDTLIKLKYNNVLQKSLDEVFYGGITKTNVKRLIHSDFSVQILKCGSIQTGDMISTHKGSHILIVVDIREKEIIYAHSSFKTTKIKGVHTGKIRLDDVEKSLEYQNWQEESNKSENYQQKYFFPECGDGIYRLKIFARG